MDNETEELVNRALYKQIKSMNRAEMETFVRNVFAQGYQRAEEETHPIDYDSLRADLSKIKGIGESRLNEIMTVIDKHIAINNDGNQMFINLTDEDFFSLMSRIHRWINLVANNYAGYLMKKKFDYEHGNQ